MLCNINAASFYINFILSDNQSTVNTQQEVFNLMVTRKTKRNAAKVNATLRFILQILFKTVAVTFARRRF